VDQLACLGEALQYAFKGRSEGRRPWQPEPKANAGDFTPGEPNVVVAAKRSSVLVQLMSLYAQLCQRLPEAEEVLVCTSNTTREHIRLLLLRCLGAGSAGRNSRLYCLTHIEQLSFELQSYTTQEYTRLCAANPEQYASTHRLVTISGEAEGQEMVTAWANYARQKLEVLPIFDIRKALEQHFSAHNMRVCSFTSEFAGMGKSHKIHEWCCHGEANVNPHRLAIHGHMGRQELASLLADRQDKQPVFHLDLAPNVGLQFNTILFELLVLGMIQQSHDQMLYWPPNSTIALEVPNSINNSTRARLHFLDLLPATELVESDNPIITSVESAMAVATYVVNNEQVYQNRVQYVCKFLKAFSAAKLHNENLVPHLIADLPSKEYCFCILFIVMPYL